MNHFLPNFGRSKLRDKFILAFIVLACVPALVLGGTTMYFISLAHSNDVSKLERNVLDERTSEIEKFLADTLGLLELRLEALNFGSIEGSGIEGQELLAEGILHSNPAFQEVSFVDSAGIEVAKVSRAQEVFDLLVVQELPYFRAARNGENFIGDIHHTLAGPIVTFAAPVVADGIVFQVLAAQVNMSGLLKSVESGSFGASGYVALFDKNGVFVSNQSRGGIPPGYDASNWLNASKVLGTNKLSGSNQSERYESLFERTEVVGIGKQIPQTGWILLAEWPLAEADAVIGQVRNQILLVTVGSIIAVLLFAYIFAARMVRPIRVLQESTLEIEKGNFDKKVTLHTNDELQDLGKSFNKMTTGLKRLQELREEFVFVAAHELRTPVTIIKGYASMALEGDAGKINSTLKTYLQEIQAANKKLLQLVEDLLEVARSEAGKIRIEVRRISLAEPVVKTVTELNQLAAKKNIAIQYQPFRHELFVLADERRVQEIVTNLVGNAIKYTREGGKVRVYHTVKNNRAVTHIEDNGFGIAAAAQKKIFQKFYRVQTDKTKRIPGTGLGLFIVKELVEKMKGQIWFVSQEGRGTTFSFSLPIKK